jgi:hypothetical protein
LQPSQYQGLIERRLRAFAERVSTAAHVRWDIDFRPSSRYRLKGKLVFSPPVARDPEELDAELAVVGVRLDGEAGWVFDVMNRRRRVIAEASVSASADSTAVMNTFSAFLDQAGRLVPAVLRWEAEKPPLAERLAPFEPMWTSDAHRYVLCSPNHSPIDISGDVELFVLIEDDEVAEAVKERMLTAGVPVRKQRSIAPSEKGLVRVRRSIYYRLDATGKRRYMITFVDSTGRQRWKTIEGGLREADAELEAIRRRARRGGDVRG